MNYDEVKLRRLIGKCQWTFAKTMPTCPHEYIVRNKCALSDEEFVFLCSHKENLVFHNNGGNIISPIFILMDISIGRWEIP